MSRTRRMIRRLRQLRRLLVPSLGLATSLFAFGCMADGQEQLSDPLLGEGESSPSSPVLLAVEEIPAFVSARHWPESQELRLDFLGPAADMGLEVGQVVSGTSDGGYLVEVESVEFAGNSAWVRGPQVSLELVFDEANVSEHWAWDASARETLDLSGRQYSGEGLGVTLGGGQLRLEPDMQIDAKIKFFSLKEAIAVLNSRFSSYLDLSFEATEAGSLEVREELDRWTFPLEGKVGPVRFSGRLETVVHLDLDLSTEGAGRGRKRLKNDGSLAMGGHYRKSGQTWDRIWTPVFEGEIEDLGAEGAAVQGRAALRMESVIFLDKVKGSSQSMSLGMDFLHEPGCEGLDAQTRGFLRGEGTMRLGFFSDGPREETYPVVEEPAAQTSVLWPSLSPELGCDDESGDEGAEEGDAGAAGPEAVPGQIVPSENLECGESTSGDSSDPVLASSLIGGYPEMVGNYSGPEQGFGFIAPAGTDEVSFSLVDAQPTVLNQDVFVLRGEEGACNAEGIVDWGFNAVEFTPEAGVFYCLVVDGGPAEAGAFVVDLSCS